MNIVWTPQAVAGWQEVVLYIRDNFGVSVMEDFEKRTLEAEMNISLMPNLGAVEWKDANESVVYRYVIINRRSKMLYYMEDDTIYIADFWDVRKNK